MAVYRVTPADAASGVQVGNRYYPGYPPRAAGGSAGTPAVDPRCGWRSSPCSTTTTSPRPSAWWRRPRRHAATRRVRLPGVHVELRQAPSAGRRRFSGRSCRDPRGDALLQASRRHAEERLDAFLKINGDLRRANERRIEDWRAARRRDAVAGNVHPDGSPKAEAVFADYRTYVYDGRDIDRRCTSAPTWRPRAAAITASNTGIVIFAGFLGIYGNCVGSITGWACSRSMPSLERHRRGGDRINRARSSRSAPRAGGGDHLHFTVLVAGRRESVEWWDPHWIADGSTESSSTPAS